MSSWLKNSYCIAHVVYGWLKGFFSIAQVMNVRRRAAFYGKQRCVRSCGVCGVSWTEGLLQGWRRTLVRFGPLFTFMSLYGLWFQRPFELFYRHYCKAREPSCGEVPFLWAESFVCPFILSFFFNESCRFYQKRKKTKIYCFTPKAHAWTLLSWCRHIFYPLNVWNWEYIPIFRFLVPGTLSAFR